MVVSIRVLFWVPTIIRHLLFRVPKKGLTFDNYPHGSRRPLTGARLHACKLRSTERLRAHRDHLLLGLAWVPYSQAAMNLLLQRRLYAASWALVLNLQDVWEVEEGLEFRV